MKRKFGWWSAMAVFGAVCLCVLLAHLSFSSSYKSARLDEAGKFRSKLDVPLETPFKKDLYQLRGSLQQWKANYKELQVPARFDSVHKQVERALDEGDALAAKTRTISATDYQSGLSAVQSKVLIVPRIGNEVYEEGNPWWSGYFVHVGKFVGMVFLVLLGVVGTVVAMIAIAAHPTRDGSTPDSSPSTFSGSGGFGGEMEWGWHGENWPPPPHPPTFPPRNW